MAKLYINIENLEKEMKNKESIIIELQKRIFTLESELKKEAFISDLKNKTENLEKKLKKKR